MATKHEKKRKRCTIYLDDDLELLKAVKAWMKTVSMNNLSSAFKLLAKERLGVNGDYDNYIRAIVRDELQKARAQGVEL